MFQIPLKIFTPRGRGARFQDGGVLFTASKRSCLTFSSAASTVQGSNNRNRCPDKPTPRVGHLPLRYPLLPSKSPVTNTMAFVIGEIHGMRSRTRAKAEADGARARVESRKWLPGKRISAA